MLKDEFFDRGAVQLARDLLGVIIRRKYRGRWLSLRIIEAEAYKRSEKGSHASLGRTKSREALFMPPGTIYMYYARGGDSLNVSSRGAGNAVLIKSAFPWFDERSPESTLKTMQQLNPAPSGAEPRPRQRIAKGQTLLCRSLALRVPEWNEKRFDANKFFFEDTGERPASVIRAVRLGIPKGRDEHLLYRFIDRDFVKFCTENPTTKRSFQEGREWRVER